MRSLSVAALDTVIGIEALAFAAVLFITLPLVLLMGLRGLVAGPGGWAPVRRWRWRLGRRRAGELFWRRGRGFSLLSRSG